QAPRLKYCHQEGRELSAGRVSFDMSIDSLECAYDTSRGFATKPRNTALLRSKFKMPARKPRSDEAHSTAANCGSQPQEQGQQGQTTQRRACWRTCRQQFGTALNQGVNADGNQQNHHLPDENALQTVGHRARQKEEETRDERRPERPAIGSVEGRSEER